MKTYCTLLIIALITLNTAAQEHSTNDPFAYFQESWNQKIDQIKEKAPEVIKKIGEAYYDLRWRHGIRMGDIRMVMKTNYNQKEQEAESRHIGHEGKGISEADVYYGYFSQVRNASMTAEYDWDNSALKMAIIDEGGFSGVGKYHYIDGVETFKGPSKNHKKDTIIQYTDKDGYWYSPVQFEGEKGDTYVKFDAMGLATGALEELHKGLSGMDIYAKRTAFALWHIQGIIRMNHPDLDFLLSDLGYALVDDDEGINIGDFIVDKHSEGMEYLERLMEDLSKVQTKMIENNIKGLPVFIHWAFLNRPDIVAAKYNINPETITFKGSNRTIPNCTKLTIPPGRKEAGKYMIFDPIGRLIFINALKDGTAEYFYDQDITVKIPEAIPFDILGPVVKKGLSQKKRIDDAVVKKKEELQSKAMEEFLEYINSTKNYLETSTELNTEYEEQQYYEKQREKEREKEREEKITPEREKELEKLKQELYEAILPQERKKIQEKIDELKKLIEKEGGQ